MIHDITYALLGRAHLSPSASAFVGDLFGFGRIPQLFSDGGTSTLHIQEVWSEGAFWSIGIMRSSLAFLLAITLDLDWSCTALRRVTSQ